MPTGCQNGIKTNAPNYTESMLKLVTKKILNVINIGFEGLAGCVREREKVSKKHQMVPKSIPKSMTKSMQNLCSKKWCKKHRKSSTLEFKRGPKTIKETFQNLSRNFIRKMTLWGSAVSRRTCQRTLTNQQDSLLFTYIKTKVEGNNIVSRWHTKKASILRGANTPWAHVYIYIYIYISCLRQGSASGWVGEGAVQRKGSISVKVPVAYSAGVLWKRALWRFLY